MERIEELEQMTLDELESFLQEENFNEIALEEQLEQHFSELNLLEEEKKVIGNEDHLVSMVKDVVWQEFMNQVGVKGGTDFIEENENKLNLKKDAHIQTTENFEKGIIADHNKKIDYQKRYDDWDSRFQKDKEGSRKLDHQAGKDKEVLHKSARVDFDKGRPKGTATVHKDHTIPTAEINRDVVANAHLSREEQVQFANSEHNLHDLDAAANQSKGDHTMTDWLRSVKDGKKPAERFALDEKELKNRDKKARKKYAEVKDEGERRSIKLGKQSRREEAFRVGGQMLRTTVITLFSKLMNEIMSKFVQWLKSAKKSLKTLMEYMKEALRSFFKGLKRTVLQISESALTTLLTSIFGSIVRTFKKIWVMLKTSLQSVQEAFRYLTNPANRNEPLEIRIAEVGKIIVAGLSAAGTAGLTPVIEGVLSTTFPPLAFEIPIIGSLSSLIALFLGGTISGVIGAIVIHRINKFSERKQIEINRAKQIDKKNDILMLQEEYTVVKNNNFQTKKIIAEDSITQRHVEAQNQTKDALDNIFKNSVEIDKRSKEINDKNDELIDDLEFMMKKLSE